MDHISNFIIIDDEKISTLLCEIALKNSFVRPAIKKFSNPVDALIFLGKEYANEFKPKRPTLLFLDLYMPNMDGWEFLKCYAAFNERVKSQVNIIILSSSNDPEDKMRAINNIYISDYIVKPLLQDILYVTLAKYKGAA